MATVTLRKLDGTEQTADWPARTTKSDISSYYANDICAIIDTNAGITALGSDVGETVDDNQLFSSNDLPALKYVKFNGVTELYPQIFYNSSNLISAELSSVSAFVQGTYGGAIYEGGQFASSDNLKYINLASITEFRKQNLGTATVKNEPFYRCGNLQYVVLSSDAGSGTLLTADTSIFSDLLENYTLIAGDHMVWQQSLERYQSHFTETLEITEFSLKAWRQIPCTYQCPRISKDFLKKCIEAYYIESDQYPSTFELINSNSDFALLEDVFRDESVSCISYIIYDFHNSIYPAYGSGSYLDDSYLTAQSICVNLFSAGIDCPRQFFPTSENYAQGLCVLKINYDESVPESYRTFLPFDYTFYEGNDAIEVLDLGNIMRIGQFDDYGNCGNITSSYKNLAQIIGNDLTAIGSGGIAGTFYNLTTMDFPFIYMLLDNSMRFNCQTSVTLNVDFGNLEYIGNAAFKGNNSIGSLSGLALTAIGNEAFRDAINIHDLYAPSLISVGCSAFMNKDDLYPELETVTAPLLRHIGDCAFCNCTQLSNVFASDIDTMNCYMAQTIGEYAFQNCKSIKSINGRFVEYLGVGAFNGCENMTAVNFPILPALSGGEVLSGCPNLKSVWLPKISSDAGIQLTSKNLTAFCNYSETIDIDYLPDELQMIQLRGISVNNIGSYNTGAWWLEFKNDDCLVMGLESPGATWETVKYGEATEQKEAVPDPRIGWKDWMHLCLDPEAAPWLSDVFLANSNFCEEYAWYIASDEFANANYKHDYSPKYCGSIYD